MTVENFVHFIIKYNAVLIEGLIATILLTVAFLAFRSFLVGKEELAGGGAADLSKIEEALKKILERANQVPSTAGASADSSNAGSSAESATLINEITTLKKELEAKQVQIEQLKATPTEPGMTVEDKVKLEGQIKELQGKLNEYEIISEDIADLSQYKEENKKLQEEIAKLKSGAPVSAAPVAASSVAATDTPVVPEAPPAEPPVASAPPPPAPTVEENQATLESLLAEVAAAPAEPLPTEPAPAAPAAAPAPVAEAVPVEPPAPVAEVAATPPAAAAPTAAAPVAEATTEVANEIDEDVMQGFVEAVEARGGKITDKPTEPVAADLGSMDLEKMATEASTLEAQAPAAEPANALSENLDPEKLLKEADSMTAAAKPQDQELLGQFEDFMKKGKA